MSTTADLMGSGMPAALANRLGNTPVTQAGAGTITGATATLIQGHLTNATTASSQTAFIFNSAASLGKEFYFFNSSATTALVYPPAGGNLNGGSADASFSVAQNKLAMFIRLSTNNWAVILTA